jgi:hypothetical protein
MLKATEEKNRIQIRIPLVWIRGFGSASKPHGSGTLLKNIATVIIKLRNGPFSPHYCKF